MNAADSNLVGRVLRATWRVERALGGGGMGAVYVATHLRTGRECALKVLHPELVTSYSQIARFRQEATVLSRLRHPNIVSVVDFDVDEGVPFLVMELLHGETLAAWIAQRGVIDWNSAVQCCVQLCSALEVAHAAGVIHRDIKPANILMTPTPDGTPMPMLLDFGVAKVTSGETVTPHLTTTGTMLGTPAYASPEQVRGVALDGRTDVYSLAAVLFEMLTGQPPYVANNVADLVVHLLTAPLPSLLQRARTPVPNGAESVLQTALAKEVHARYSSARDFGEALRRLGPTTQTSSALLGYERTGLQYQVPSGSDGYAVPRSNPIGFTPTDAALPQTAPQTIQRIARTEVSNAGLLGVPIPAAPAISSPSGVAAPAPPPTAQPTQPVRNRSWLVFLLAGLVVLLLSTTVGLIVLNRPSAGAQAEPTGTPTMAPVSTTPSGTSGLPTLSPSPTSPTLQAPRPLPGPPGRASPTNADYDDNFYTGSRLLREQRYSECIAHFRRVGLNPATRNLAWSCALLGRDWDYASEVCEMFVRDEPDSSIGRDCRRQVVQMRSIPSYPH